MAFVVPIHKRTPSTGPYIYTLYAYTYLSIGIGYNELLVGHTLRGGKNCLPQITWELFSPFSPLDDRSDRSKSLIIRNHYRDVL